METPNKSNQNQKPQLSRTGRLVSEQPPGLLTKEVEKDVLFGCESTNSSTETLVSGQPTGLFTQCEEIDIDFRVSGLPHAVVKEAENFRYPEIVKKIESHPHREAFHADLQQNNIYNPFSDNSKAMIRELGNVELYSRLQSRSHNHEPLPPRIRRRTCRTYSFSPISKVAPFFFKWFMLELGHVQKLAELMRKIHVHMIVCCNRVRLQLIAICCNRPEV